MYMMSVVFKFMNIFAFLMVEGIADVSKHYLPQKIRWLAICSNDSSAYPEDAPDKMVEFANEFNFTFPYLWDETQAVAKAYQAACTPDCFIFDSNLYCVYRGRFDESRPGSDTPVTGHDLAQALDAILAGQVVESNQFPSIGCSIKWR